MKQKKRIKPDCFVKSEYAARWSGVVIDREKRKDTDDLCQVLVLKDKNGNTPRKRIIETLSAGWLVEIDKFDISNINQDWFKNIPEL